MIAGWARRVLWNSESDRTETAPVATPPALRDPEAIARKLFGSFQQIEDDAAWRVSFGYYVGRLQNGRKGNYGSNLAAGVDERLGKLEDAATDAEEIAARLRIDDDFDPHEYAVAQAAADAAYDRFVQAKRYAPLSERWRLRRDLAAVSDAPVAGAASSVTEPPPQVTIEPRYVPTVAGYDASIRAARQERHRIEAARRAATISKYEVRQAALAGSAAPDPEDALAQRVDLERKLDAWNESNPKLVAEIAAFSRRDSGISRARGDGG